MGGGEEMEPSVDQQELWQHRNVGITAQLTTVQIKCNYLQTAVAVPAAPSGPLAGMVAPLSGQSLGLQRAQVTHGIREVSV
jgi:hypothetical protein